MPTTRSEYGATTEVPATRAPRAGSPVLAGEEPSPEARWLRALAGASAAALAAWGGVGLVLADFGHYRGVLAALVGFAVWCGVLWLVRPVLVAPARRDRSAQLASVGALVVAVADGWWNAAHASTHVLTDSDPGVYTNTGVWIAQNGNLVWKAGVGPFAGRPFDVSTPGVYVSGASRRVVFQFAHLLPAVLAEARGLGGDAAMFRAVPVLGGVALLAFFVAAARVLRRPWCALGATAVLAVAMPQVHFSRDAYSEIPTQVLLFSALWLLCDRAARRHWRVAAVAGLFVGLLAAARIDAFAIVAGLPILFALAWYRTPHGDRRGLLASATGALAGVAVGLGAGLTDLIWRSAPYWHSLHSDVLRLEALTSVSVLVAGAAVLGEAPLRRLGARLVDGSARRTAANIVAVVVVAAGVFGWVVRPAMQPLHAVFTRVPTPAMRVPDHASYARSVSWLGWYLGPLTLACAIAGAALVARSFVLHARWRWAVPAALLVPETVLYLWRPSAVPIQLWVTRRLTPTAFPVVVLATFGVVSVALAVAGRWRRYARVAAVVVTVSALGFPLATLVAVHSMTEQQHFVEVVRDACAAAGGDAAVVALEEGTSELPQMLIVPMRTWCGVPTARDVRTAAHADDPAPLLAAARAWHAHGRRLWMVASKASTIRHLFPSAAITTTRHVVNRRSLTVTRWHRPRGYRTERFTLALAPVPCCGD